MKVNMHGMDMEMTVEEYAKLAELFGEKPEKDVDGFIKELSFEEEMHVLHHLKYFKIIETEISTFGGVTFTVKGDLG